MNAIKTHTITATATDSNLDTRYKNLANSAATQMAEYLSTELPGFTLSGITYDSSSNYLPYIISLKNDKWGCELLVGVTSKYSWSSAFSFGYSNGLAFYFKVITGDKTYTEEKYIHEYYSDITSTGDTITATFDLTISSLESIAISVGVAFKRERESVYGSMTISSFTGSYSGDVVVGRGSSTSSVNMLIPTSLAWVSNGKDYAYKFESYSSSNVYNPNVTYYLRPYSWFANADPYNFGLALFDNKYVLYCLAFQGSDVSTTPGNKYIIDGEEHTAVTNFLIVPKPCPFRKLQKPGEVLTW